MTCLSSDRRSPSFFFQGEPVTVAHLVFSRSKLLLVKSPGRTGDGSHLVQSPVTHAYTYLRA